MASPDSDMMTSQPSLMNSGKLEAVQTDHRKKIGSMPQKNCDPALTPVDPVLGEGVPADGHAPATTLVLLKLKAVVGVTGFFNASGGLRSLAGGIGHRLGGWANRDLNVRLNLDGKAFRPVGTPAAVLLPPAFGLAGVNQHTWGGGWGNVTYWNAYVDRLMHAEQYPVAAKGGHGNMRAAGNKATAHLAAREFPNKAVAARGTALGRGKARCAQCRAPPLFTEPGWNTNKAEDIGMDGFQANRSPDRSYRTAPLRGLWSHQRRGFYHDRRFATLLDVTEHYNTFNSWAWPNSRKATLSKT
jgi:hypothetical protein